MGDLECELGHRETGILGPGSDPVNMRIVRRSIGVQPKFGRSPCGLDERRVQGPESNVMALPWAVINCLLEADILAASEKVKRAERGGRVGRVKYECPDHAPRACQPQPVGLRPAGGCKCRVQLLKRADEHEIDGV